MDTGTGEERRGRLKLNQLPILMLILKLMLICTMEDMVGDTLITGMDMLATTVLTDTATGEERRGRLKLNQLPILMLILKLMLICTMEDMATGEEKRGRLKLNQLLILMLILKLTLTCTMV